MFHIVDGIAKDWSFRDMLDDQGYFFYLDEIFIGYIYRMHSHAFTAIAVGRTPNGHRCVKGFGSREDAAEYLIQVMSYEIIRALK